jgi:hypothetical protein
MVTKVDNMAKEGILFMIAKAAGVKKPDYAGMHIAVKSVQTMLEKNYGVSLGYDFKGASIHQNWDNDLQNDIERYNGICSDIVIEDDKIVGISKGANLLLTEFVVGEHLKKQFGKNLYKQIQACV